MWVACHALIAMEVAVVIWGADLILIVMYELEWMLIHASSESNNYELIIFPFGPKICSSGVVG